tara:strand:+ start:67 stop:903 length:837 start_codon:yes stop_codon:yes gene_type:complete
MESLNPMKEKSTNQSIIDSVKSLNPFQEQSTTEKMIDSVKSLNPIKEKSASEKLMDSVKSLNPVQEKSNTEKVMDKFSLNSAKSIIPQSGVSSWQSWAFRFFLLFVILALLGINLWAYLVKGTDVFSDKLRIVVSNSSESILDTLQTTFDNLVKGTRFSTGILADTVKSFINLLKGIFAVQNLKPNESATLKQEKKEKESDVSKTIDKKGKKNNNNSEADVSESVVQQKKTAGFCYVGHQTPHNACLEVDDVKKCMSGKVFKTMEQCNSYKPSWNKKH